MDAISFVEISMGSGSKAAPAIDEAKYDLAAARKCPYRVNVSVDTDGAETAECALLTKLCVSSVGVDIENCARCSVCAGIIPGAGIMPGAGIIPGAPDAANPWIQTLACQAGYARFLPGDLSIRGRLMPVYDGELDAAIENIKAARGEEMAARFIHTVAVSAPSWLLKDGTVDAAAVVALYEKHGLVEVASAMVTA